MDVSENDGMSTWKDWNQNPLSLVNLSWRILHILDWNKKTYCQYIYIYWRALNFQTSLLVQVRNNKDCACVNYGMFLLPKVKNCFLVVVVIVPYWHGLGFMLLLKRWVENGPLMNKWHRIMKACGSLINDFTLYGMFKHIHGKWWNEWHSVQEVESSKETYVNLMNGWM